MIKDGEIWLFIDNGSVQSSYVSYSNGYLIIMWLTINSNNHMV